MQTAKTLIRLGGSPDWSESSLGVCHFVVFVVRRLNCLCVLFCWSSSFFGRGDGHLLGKCCPLACQLVLYMSPIMRKHVLPYANNKCTDQPVHPRSLISAFVVHCLDGNHGIIPLLAISEISSLWLVAVAEQAGLSLTWSQLPKTDVLATGLICTWCQPWCLCSSPDWCLGHDVAFDCVSSWSLPFHLLRIPRLSLGASIRLGAVF